jgi:hypothetical protein
VGDVFTVGKEANAFIKQIYSAPNACFYSPQASWLIKGTLSRDFLPLSMAPLTRAHISVHQTTPGLTRGSPSFYITNAGGEPRVKLGVWRPEMLALRSVGSGKLYTLYLQ